jgi:hypothetical protein
MKRVFADTWFYLAALNPADPNHARSVALGHFAAFSAEALLRDVPTLGSFARWRRPNPGSPKPPKATPKPPRGYPQAIW